MSVTEPDPRDPAEPGAVSADSEPSGWKPGSWWWGIAGVALLWLAFPPVGWWPLAWVAPVPWMAWVYRARWDTRRPYRMVWVIGTLYWLATFYFIPLPHPALWLGWLVVSAYLGLYLCLFVAASRVWVHRWGCPFVVVAPLMWTGVEWLRSNLLTGMGMVGLAHSQFDQPILIQVSDLFGGYTLTALMALVSAAWCAAVFRPDGNIVARSWKPLASAAGTTAVVLGCVLAYGSWRLNQTWTEPDSKPVIVALIQGSIDTEFPSNDEEAMAYYRRRDEQYFQLSREARERWDDIDLMVWPESAFPFPDFLPESPLVSDRPEVIAGINANISELWSAITFGGPPFSLLAGTTTYDQDGLYNSAVLVQPPGRITGRYLKNHLVMFGEYVPLADWFPILQQMTPIGRGLKSGQSPWAFSIRDRRFSPNICFETTVGHLIRRHMNELRQRGESPDAMINITNDGWFFGTSCLDFHLACNVFRAVENRTPNLVCANTGLSAHIDAAGRLVSRGPRRQTEVLRAEVAARPSGATVYQKVGDWPITVLTLLMLLGWAASLLVARRD